MKREDAIKQLSRAVIAGGVTELRAGGKQLAADQVADLLARAVKREMVELELTVHAYEQEPGKPNRNGVRFRDGLMRALGRSGRGNPFLRDHRQSDVTARGGTILESDTEAIEGGGHAIKQSVRLTEPAAVERALRGNMSAVSIGWNPTGPVLCSHCGTEVLDRCYHWPLDVLETERGPVTVEWVFTEAELLETSEVSIGGVPNAHIEHIRAAFLSARGDDHSGTVPRGHSMNLLSKIIPILALAATAGDSDALAAVEALKKDNETKSKELALADAENAKLAARVAEFEQVAAKRDEDDFIAAALKSGRIDKSDEPVWRDLFQANAGRAKERMEARKPGQATPVGQPRQSDPGRAAADPEPNTTEALFTGAGINYGLSVQFAKAFGAKDPKKALARVAGEEA